MVSGYFPVGGTLGKLLLALIMLLPAAGVRGEHYRQIVVVGSDNPSAVEQNILDVLKRRILEKTEVGISTIPSSGYRAKEGSAPGTLFLFAGIASGNTALNVVLESMRLTAVSADDPGPEGFLFRAVPAGPGKRSVAILNGVDQRGLLYAVGAFLRECGYLPQAIEIGAVNRRTAPAFEIRGTQYGQSSVALTKAKARPWSREEKHRAILDLALAGANIFLTESTPKNELEELAFLKSFDLMACSVFHVNQAPAGNFPEEWRASESIGRPNYLCPSVPGAHRFILEECEKKVKNSPAYDFIQLKGGDGGGCECDRCKPYGNVFIHLSEKIAEILHRYHPKTRIYFTNQKFDNESDSAILHYLNEKPREWLWAWGYGPGSDATTWQPGHRQNHRMDLFRYPGFGPYGLYPKTLLHELPSRHKILYFNELTHWKYAQHGYAQMYPRADKDGNLPPRWSHEIYERRPDQTLTMVYNRLSFFAWPKYYHRVFNDLMRYGAGDITHSSGNHDHFNQWMWQRLLWNPRLETGEVVNEYAVAWFGREAAPLMSEALLQLESNLEELPGEPLQIKRGIEVYYRKVAEAGRKIPPHLLKNNWLWRMYMQKGALDRYIKLDLQQQLAVRQQVEQLAGAYPKNVSWTLLTGKIDKVLAQETPEMTRLRGEAEKLGEESNVLFGTRSEAIFDLRHDYIGLGWLKRQIGRIQQAENEISRKQLVSMITDYEGRKINAIYDNLGTGNHAQHVTTGYPYDHGQPYVPTMLSEANRPSQRSMHFTQDEEQGVTLSYRDLPEGKRYQLRLTLVRPVFQERYLERMKQRSQSVYANGILLAQNLELPEGMSDFFTFDLPGNCIRDGKLEIKLMPDPALRDRDRVSTEQWRNTGGWGTLLSEAWLIPEQE